MRKFLSLSPISLTLALWAFFIPIWNVGASIAMGLLFIATITNAIKTKNYPSLTQSKYFILLLLSILVSTAFHFDSAVLNELKTILPFCIAPILFSNQNQLQTKEKKFVWFALISGVVISLIASIAYGLIHFPLADPRKASFLISHIRLSLLASVLFFYTLSDKQFNRLIPFVLLTLSLFFLYITATISGLIFFLIGSITYLILLKKFRFLFILFIPPIVVLIYLFPFYYQPSPKSTCFNNETLRGEPYVINNSPFYTENGFLTYSCLSEKELIESWNQRTGINIEGFDERNQPIKQTIIRYLTSKGLSKDAEGVFALNDQDIQNIKSGYTNCLEINWNAIEKRAYQIHFEYTNFKNGGKSVGHSIFQRFYMIDITKNILLQHPAGGVGVSNSRKLFEQGYAQLEITDDNMPKQPHNQFLTLWLNSGVLSLIFFLMLLIRLFQQLKDNVHVIGASCFLIIFTTSCFTEDTLNTQPGVGISTLFIILFFFLQSTEQKASNALKHSQSPKL
jgi:hypothetical protein